VYLFFKLGIEKCDYHFELGLEIFIFANKGKGIGKNKSPLISLCQMREILTFVKKGGGIFFASIPGSPYKLMEVLKTPENFICV